MIRFVTLLFSRRTTLLRRQTNFTVSSETERLNCKQETRKRGLLLINREKEENMPEDIFKYKQLLSLTNNNTDLAKKLLLAFLDELKPIPDVFKPSPTNKNMDDISKLTHKIKPSLQLFELHGLNQKMNEYKMNFREGSEKGKNLLPGLYEEIMQAYLHIKNEINEYIQKMN
jgi:hypothetical protein